MNLILALFLLPSGFYRGIAPGLTGSLATGATYFGVIESTKKWLDETHPGLGGHWSHFIAGAVGRNQNINNFLVSEFTFGNLFQFIP